MAKKTKVTPKDKKKKTFGKPVNVSGVAGGRPKSGGPGACGCTGMPQDPVGS